jgi:undecaprenyl diphosphate synthase
MEEERIPRAIGIIPDGNRRWAKARGVPQLEGHRAGYQKLKEVANWAFDRNITHLFVYAFSAENRRRPAGEVSYLMDLFRWVLSWEINEMHAKGVRVCVIGDRATFSPDLQEMMSAAEKKTKENQKGTLVLCLSYGGRPEILAGVKQLLRVGAAPESITEAVFESALWSSEFPDPDLIIRTSGEKRLSNFLTWRSAYSEFAFTDTLWPDLTEAEFDQILADFAGRERRYGK